MKRLFDLVEVEWEDTAAQDNGWIEKIEGIRPHYVSTVGHLVFLDKRYIVVAQDVDQEEQHNGRTQIPRALVKKFKVLRRKD